MKKTHAFILLPLIMAACTKEKKEPVKGCFIREIKETDISSLSQTSKWVHVLMYNDDGSMAKVISTPLNDPDKTELKMFSYAANRIFVDHFTGNSGKRTSRDSIVLDNDKRISAVFKIDKTGELSSSEAMTYDNEEQVISMTSGSLSKAYYNGQLQSVEFTYGSPVALYWAGGDLISWDKQNSINYYDTAYNVGVIKASYDELLSYGRAVKKRTRLRKSTAWPNDTLYSAYQLDGEGKMLKWTEASKTTPQSSILEYTYECR